MRVRFRRKSGARGRNLSVWPRREGMFEVREVEDPVSGDFVGFVTVWNMPEGFAYVEHFCGDA